MTVCVLVSPVFGRGDTIRYDTIWNLESSATLSRIRYLIVSLIVRKQVERSTQITKINKNECDITTFAGIFRRVFSTCRWYQNRSRYSLLA